jgi:hypothetical protein
MLDNMQEEEWRIIEDFPDYQVSTLGRVKSTKFHKEKIMKPRLCGKYLYVDLWKNKKLHMFLLHRLIGITFLPNPENKPEIDHINRNKLDNRLENLAWATKKEQAANRDNWFRTTNTGEPYISFRKDQRFTVQKSIQGKKYHKFFKTLEEAIAYRDTILNQIPSTQEV